MGTHLLQPSPGPGSEWGLCRGGRTAVEGMKTGEGGAQPCPPGITRGEGARRQNSISAGDLSGRARWQLLDKVPSTPPPSEAALSIRGLRGLTKGRELHPQILHCFYSQAPQVRWELAKDTTVSDQEESSSSSHSWSPWAVGKDDARKSWNED